MSTARPHATLAWLGLPPGALAVLTACAAYDDLDAFDARQDTFVQADTDMVDVLWVIDDSSTMEENQDRLAQQLPTLTDILAEAGSDLHMGVVTTSVDSEQAGVLIGQPPFVTTDQIDAFAPRLRVGTEGSDKERGLEAALLALSDRPNPGFLRPDARLLTIVLSDEEDCSDAGALAGEGPTSCYTQSERLTPVAAIVEELQGLKGDPNQVVVSAVVGVEGSACSYVYEGRRYQQVAMATGGPIADICDESWEPSLAELGQIAAGVRSRFRLRDPAQPDSLAVFVDDVSIPADPSRGFWYDPETWFVHFAPVVIPLPGQTIRVDYVEDTSATGPTY